MQSIESDLEREKQKKLKAAKGKCLIFFQPRKTVVNYFLANF